MESKQVTKKIVFNASDETIREYDEIIKKAENTIRENEATVKKYKELISKGINGRIGVYCIESEDYYDIVSDQFSRHNIETFRCSFDDLKDTEKYSEKPWDILLILVNHNIPTHDITITINKLLADTNLHVDFKEHHIVKIMLTDYVANDNMYTIWNELMEVHFDQFCMYDINFFDNVRHLAKMVHYMNRGYVDINTLLIESNLKPVDDSHFSKFKKPDDKCRIKRLGIYYIGSDDNNGSNDNNLQDKNKLQYEDYFYSIVQQLAPHNVKVLRSSYGDLINKDMSKTKNEMVIFLVDHNMPSCDIANKINKLLVDTNLRIDGLGNLVKIMLTGIVGNDLENNIIINKYDELIEAYIKNFCTSDFYLFNHVLKFSLFPIFSIN